MSEAKTESQDNKDSKRRKNANLFHTIEASVLGIENMEFFELYDNLKIEQELDENCKYVYGDKGGLYEIKDCFYQDCVIDSSQTDLKAAVDLLNPSRKLVAKIYPGGGYKPCFENEIQASEQLGIFYDYLEDDEDKTHIFIREYVDGKILSDFVHDNKDLSVSERIHVFLNIVAAMDILHHHHVLHCDLKTSNILIKEDFTVELFDFGAASIIDNFAEENYPRYKYYVKYMPPELGRKGFKKPIDQRTDVFFLKSIIRKLKLRNITDDIYRLYKKIGEDDPQNREYLYEIYKAFEATKDKLDANKEDAS
ncbi:MAG: protein kinase [Francisellaceae bacterium]|jgi:serine/threonine protein kinase|nr:protein kinase [Francisellaceae bacterium]MBT6206651.1 protein kinase [Francisellaceae bacterium]MBT6538044.1 protein kinase [Francisellaceae bacterium]